MKYWSQLEVEKMLEILYERQAAYVIPEMRKKSCLLGETSSLLLDLKESSAEEFIREMGRPLVSVKEQCDGDCSNCRIKNE